jgi:hypothetical protein
VTVVAGAEPGPGDSSLLAAYPDDGKRVVRVPWSASSRLLARLRSKLLEDRLLVPDIYRPWQRDAAQAIRSLGLLRRGDVLATFGQPMSDHLLGLRLARRAGARWVAHFSDPWADSPYRSGGALTRRVNERLEERVIREADALVFTSRETLELVLAKYPPELAAKAHALPHAHEPSLYRAPAGRKLVVRYVGNFYGPRGAASLVEALRKLAVSDPEALADVKIELIGSRDPAIPVEATSALPGGSRHGGARRRLPGIACEDARERCPARARHAIPGTRRRRRGPWRRVCASPVADAARTGAARRWSRATRPEPSRRRLPSCSSASGSLRRRLELRQLPRCRLDVATHGRLGHRDGTARLMGRPGPLGAA